MEKKKLIRIFLVRATEEEKAHLVNQSMLEFECIELWSEGALLTIHFCLSPLEKGNEEGDIPVPG